jgi:hypothetical protein
MRRGGFEGFEDVNQRFKALMDKIGGSVTQRALKEISITVQAEAAIMTPVDTSFLINSAYTKDWRTMTGWSGEVGYGAEYAAAVHNMPGTLKGTPRPSNKGNYWGPSAEPQFLYKAVKNVSQYDLPRILKNQYTL